METNVKDTCPRETQNVQLHNVQLQNVQLQNVHLRNVQLQNVQVTKRSGYQTSILQNVQISKRPGHKTSSFCKFKNLYKKTFFRKKMSEIAYFMRSVQWGLQGANLRHPEWTA